MGTTESSNKINETVKMHEYKKETLRDDCLLRVVTGIEIINARNNKAPTFVEALLFKYGTGGRTK